MFGYEDRRTEQERNRDLELAEKRKLEETFAIGFMKTFVRPRLKDGAEVGLVSSGRYGGGAELIVQVDGITYRLQASVDHDD